MFTGKTLVRMIKIIRWTIWVALFSLFPKLPLSLFNDLMDKVAKAAGREVMHGFNIMDFHATEEMGIQLCCNPQWWRPAPSLQYGTPQGVSHHCWQIYYTGPLLLQKEQHMFLLECTLTLDTDLAFLLLPKSPSGNFKNALFIIMVFHTALLLSNGLVL